MISGKSRREAWSIGTGDMSELALGWATYNGDHMSMYASMQRECRRTLVRHLVRYYADTCGDRKLSGVLLDVLDTPVSSGASAAQGRRNCTEDRGSGWTL